MKPRLFLVALIILLVAAPVALAASPHFVSATGAVASNGALEIKFKEAGLGANVSTQYVMRANSTITWGCTDKHGTVSPVNRTTVYAKPVEKWATFTSGKNGSVSATMTVGPLPPPAGWGCSGNTPKAVVVSVLYGAPTHLSGPALADYTNALLVTIPDQSAVYYP